MAQRTITIGVSLKMYFGPSETLRWCAEVVRIATDHAAISGGLVDLFVLPSAPMIAPVLDVFAGSAVQVGAQNLHTHDRGAFTGEVSGAMLRELGCRYVAVGHAERRALFGEDERTVAAKTAAALRNGLTPVLCVGERRRRTPQRAAVACTAEVRDALDSTAAAQLGPVVVAYEPRWAIGQAEPASPDHIATVASAVRAWLDHPVGPAEPVHLADRDRHVGLAGSRVIYGGSAGPGLLGRLGDRVDGLFLGRFAHDPAALRSILDEAVAVQEVAWRSV